MAFKRDTGMSLNKFVGIAMTLALIAPAFFSCSVQRGPGNRTTTETLVLEKYLINALYSKDKVISPDGRHVAYFGVFGVRENGTVRRHNLTDTLGLAPEPAKQ